MAKIQEEIVKIKLSKLTKNSETSINLITDDLVTNLESIVQELVDETIIVEVEKDKK